MEQRKKLGEIFVEQNILTPKTVERVLSIAQRCGKKFAAVLEEMELITLEEFANALAIQFKLKTVFNFAHYSFPPQVLNIIPGEVALENCIFPLKLDGDRLAMAIADPTITRIVDNIATNNNLNIVLFVAPRRDINDAVSKHYFGMDVVESSQKTVLVVEDDKLILAMLNKILSGEYKVITATDGMQGYKEVISKRPHVILTDKEMPKLDGYGLLDSLRTLPEAKQIPVILISGNNDAEVEAEAFAKGFFDFIAKPVKELTLLTRVKRAFDFVEKQRFLFIK
jgi:CheY-like chemotaxis protein